MVIDGRFRLECFIAHGGMGEVFTATALQFGATSQRRAVKLLFDAVTDESSKALFLQEIECHARLQHEFVVAVHDAGIWHDQPYILMELVTAGSNKDSGAQSLLDILEAAPGKTLQPGTAVAIVEKVARALDHAHSRGVVHRDIKPGNILIRRDENDQYQPKVADFGLASMDGLCVVGGSTLYMSPEQAVEWRKPRNDGIPPSNDRATDIWSLGVTLYQMLTGKVFLSAIADRHVPSNDDFRAACESANRTLRGKKLGLDQCLVEICLKCLRIDPSMRYRTAADLSFDLSRLEHHLPPLNATVQRSHRLRHHLYRNRTAFSVVTILLAAAFGNWINMTVERDSDLLTRIESAELARATEIPVLAEKLSFLAGRWRLRKRFEETEIQTHQPAGRNVSDGHAERITLERLRLGMMALSLSSSVTAVDDRDVTKESNSFASREERWVWLGRQRAVTAHKLLAQQDEVAAIRTLTAPSDDTVPGAELNPAPAIRGFDPWVADPVFAEPPVEVATNAKAIEVSAVRREALTQLIAFARSMTTTEVIADTLTKLDHDSPSDETTDVSYALLLAAGTFEYGNASTRQIAALASRIVCDQASDCGIRSAAEWLLKTWELRNPASRRIFPYSLDCKWFTILVVDQYLTFSVVPAGSVCFRPAFRQRGSQGDEPPLLCFDVGHLAVATCEVTEKLFLTRLNNLSPEEKKFEKIYKTSFTSFVGDRAIARSQLPVRNVSWGDAMRFCGWLTGRLLEAGGPKGGVRLPADYEFVYFNRAGSGQTPLTSGSDPECLPLFAWTSIDSVSVKEGPDVVGQRMPNRWGLYDVQGNISEWTSARYAPLNDPLRGDPFNMGDLIYPRISMGGSFRSAASGCADANITLPDDRDSKIGIRIVIDLQLSPPDPFWQQSDGQDRPASVE